MDAQMQTGLYCDWSKQVWVRFKQVWIISQSKLPGSTVSEIEWPLVEANLNTVRQLCISSLTLICVNLAFQRENKIKSSIVIYKTTKSCIGHIIIWLAVFHITMLIVYIYRISVVINKISMLDWVDNSSLTIGHA